MELFIMRHGPAEDTAESGLDSDRDLTESGRERVRQVARALLDANEVPVELVSSTLVRARETAKIVRALHNVPAAIHFATELSMTNRVREIVDDLVGRDLDRRMLVGHEPELSEIVRALTGTSVRMDKAMVVGVTFTAKKARLRFVLDPKTLVFQRS